MRISAEWNRNYLCKKHICSIPNIMDFVQVNYLKSKASLKVSAQSVEACLKSMALKSLISIEFQI